MQINANILPTLIVLLAAMLGFTGKQEGLKHRHNAHQVFLWPLYLEPTEGHMVEPGGQNRKMSSQDINNRQVTGRLYHNWHCSSKAQRTGAEHWP